MNAARLLREINRVALWRYDDHKLTFAVPPGAYVMQRNVTHDTCNVQWTRNLVFNQSIPPIVPSPHGIYMAPYLVVNLRHVMTEYDPHIRVEIARDGLRPGTELSISATRDPSSRSYGDDVMLPRELRSYGVYNVANGNDITQRTQPKCMNRPMRIKRTVEEIMPDYDARPMLGRGIVETRSATTTAVPDRRRRDVLMLKRVHGDDGKKIDVAPPKSVIKKVASGTLDDIINAMDSAIDLAAGGARAAASIPTDIVNDLVDLATGVNGMAKLNLMNTLNSQSSLSSGYESATNGCDDEACRLEQKRVREPWMMEE